MKTLRKIELSCLTIAMILSATSAFAQEISQSEKFRLDPVFPASAFSPFVTTEGPVAPTSFGDWALSLVTDYAHNPLPVNIDNTDYAIISDSSVMQGSFSLATGFGTSIELSVPVMLAQQGDTLHNPKRHLDFGASHGTALGDVRAGVLFRHTISGQWDYLFGVRGWAPTGSKEAYMSDGRIRSELLAGVTGKAGALDVGLTGFVAPTSFKAYTGDRVGGSLAFSYGLGKQGPHIGAEVLFSRLRYQTELDPSSIVELWASLRHQLGPMRVALNAGPGVGVGPGNAAFRGILSVAYLSTGPSIFHEKKEKKVLDRDFDGILDKDDACPDAAGLRSENVTENGCPKGDQDGDGVPDDEDACPDQAGARQNDAEMSGCPDRDNDRVVDKLDKCPDQAAPTYANTDRLGCPMYAVRHGDNIELRPALAVRAASQDAAMRTRELRELAFLIRADDSIDVVSVEVALHVEDEQSEAALQTATEASQEAQGILNELVKLGVMRERLQPVGSMTTGEPAVRFHVAKKRKK